MEINRKQIMATFLSILDNISDKDYQKRIWIRGEGPEVDDFDESVCNFFQEGDGIIEEYKDFGLTENQYQLLKKFRDEYDVFVKKNHFPEEFIDSPEWANIMCSAKDVLNAFNYQNRTLEIYLETIERFSEKKYQERVWLLGEESECDDFTESIRRFFEEGKGILEKYKDFGITNKQYELLVKLRDQLDKFVKDPRLGHLPQGFIDTPDWEKITETANEVLKAFNYKKLRK